MMGRLALMVCLSPVAAQHLRGAVFVPWQSSFSLGSSINSNMEMHVFESTSNGEATRTQREDVVCRGGICQRTTARFSPWMSNIVVQTQSLPSLVMTRARQWMPVQHLIVQPQLDTDVMNALAQAVREIEVEDGVEFEFDEARDTAPKPSPALFMSSARQANQTPYLIILAAASGLITFFTFFQFVRLCMGGSDADRPLESMGVPLVADDPLLFSGSPALEMPATKSPTYTLDDWEDVAARECLVGVYEKANAKAELRTTRSYLSRLYANVA